MDVLLGHAVLSGPLYPLFDGPDNPEASAAAALQSQRRRDEAEKHVGLTGDSGSEVLLLAAQLRLDIVDTKKCLEESGCYLPLICGTVKRFLLAATRSVL